ncbi:hypothetical protein SCP_1400540 [Sparassis crispa]|uniref:Uncharacterized protein n=1 Tax=Sparassis crispa TaxID=139825 RepID=A0A401H2N0_9APHY|nr:hypothetical protein SCP_1400540 [Sparassis crispa]GBE88649.1 hypothetical protein SCP_1400540 [Sparassis crispa]
MQKNLEFTLGGLDKEIQTMLNRKSVPKYEGMGKQLVGFGRAPGDLGYIHAQIRHCVRLVSGILCEFEPEFTKGYLHTKPECTCDFTPYCGPGRDIDIAMDSTDPGGETEASTDDEDERSQTATGSC